MQDSKPEAAASQKNEAPEQAADQTVKPAPNPKPQPNGGPAGPKKGPNKGPGPKPAGKVVEVKPMAGSARNRQRHYGLILSFFLLVVVPFAATMFYLWAVAEDQYASTTGFTVRQDEGNTASELLGGLAQLTGGSTSSDSDILYEFIQSQEIVQSVEERLNIKDHYSAHWEADPVFALWPDASAEDLLFYWGRVVQIAYDKSTGLIEVRVLAYSADMAQRIASEIVRRSQARINALNEQAREDALGYARLDLAEAVDRLKTAREALTQFRSRTQIVDPAADLQGRMGVMNNLQQKLAEALIEHDLLLETARADDPRIAQAVRRIKVIRDRIASERQSFASDSTENGAVGEDYPTLISEFEGLTVDRKYAEQTYRAALASFELAQASAARQSRYLATYIQPTLPETAEYPRRYVLTGLIFLFLGLFWSILVLIYYSIRDRS